MATLNKIEINGISLDIPNAQQSQQIQTLSTQINNLKKQVEELYSIVRPGYNPNIPGSDTPSTPGDDTPSNPGQSNPTTPEQPSIPEDVPFWDPDEEWYIYGKDWRNDFCMGFITSPYNYTNLQGENAIQFIKNNLTTHGPHIITKDELKNGILYSNVNPDSWYYSYLSRGFYFLLVKKGTPGTIKYRNSKGEWKDFVNDPTVYHSVGTTSYHTIYAQRLNHTDEEMMVKLF